MMTHDPPGDDPAPETGLGSQEDEGDSYDEYHTHRRIRNERWWS